MARSQKPKSDLEKVKEFVDAMGGRKQAESLVRSEQRRRAENRVAARRASSHREAVRRGVSRSN